MSPPRDSLQDGSWIPSIERGDRVPESMTVPESITILQRLTALETTIPQLEKQIAALRDELTETRHLVGV